MPRPKLSIPSVEKNISIPLDLATKVDLELYSEVESRVPFGAWKGFVTRLIRQYFERQTAVQELQRTLALVRDDTTLSPGLCEHLTRKALVDYLSSTGGVQAARLLQDWVKS